MHFARFLGAPFLKDELKWLLLRFTCFLNPEMIFLGGIEVFEKFR